MRDFFLGVLLAAGMSVPAASADNPQHWMDFACNVLYWNCDGVEPPEVVEVREPCSIQGCVLGYYYPGQNKVYLNTLPFDLWPEKYTEALRLSVLVHEATHYLDWKLHGANYMYDDTCKAEARAWHVGNAYLIYLGYPEQVTYEWHKWYGCPLPGPVTGP